MVVKLLDTDNDGKVDALDSDGDDKPNDLNGDGNFSDEVAGIAGKEGYDVGKTYWRGEITHFTPWDFNWPYAPPKDAKPPKVKNPDVDIPPTCDIEEETKSYVTVKGRVFHEDIDIAGTDLTLHYASNRVGNFKYAITANINTDELPESVYGAKVEISVAGKHYEKELHPGDDGHIEYVWDGKDATGKRVSGKVNATIKVTYLYPLVYYSASSDFSYAWNQAGSASTNIIGREKVEYSAIKTVTINVVSINKNSNIANGWSLSNVNILKEGTVYKGNGEEFRNQFTLQKGLVAYYRFENNVNDSSGLGNDGNLQGGNLKYEKGVIGKAAYFNGTQNIKTPIELTGKDENQYITIAFWGKAENKEHSVFVTNYNLGDGSNSIHMSASSVGIPGRFNGYHENGFCYKYKLISLLDIVNSSTDACGNKDTYETIYDYGSKAIDYTKWHHYAITYDNLTERIYIDGIKAIEKELEPNMIGGENKIDRYPRNDSNYDRFLNIGKLNNAFGYSDSKISETMLKGAIDNVRIYKKVLNDNEIFSLYMYGKEGRSIALSNEKYKVIDKNQIYIFNIKGQHIATKALGTNVTLETFAYDENGYLTTITDQFGQTTQIIRDERGYPTQIIAPNGQVTNLTVDENGDLVEVSYEDGSKYQFSYYAGSLLKDMVDLGGHTIGHIYDKYGRFVKETMPNGGALQFARSKDGNTTTYTQTFPEGEQRVIKDTLLANGDINSTITLPSGDNTYMSFANNYFNKTFISNGVKSVITYTTDSFTKDKTISKQTTTMPSTLSKSTTYNTSYDGNDTVINSKTQTITTNNKTTTITTNYQEGVESITSPMGKTITRSFDIDTLLTKELKFNNLEPINYTYNDKGQIIQVTQGDRSVSITYDSRGNIASITNPLGLTTTYEYDNMDRVTKTTYPNNISLSYSYDSYGNIIKRVIPTDKEHKFTYNFASNPTKYITPTNTQTIYSYDKANRLKEITKPDGSKIDYTYTKGRLTQIVSPNQTINYTYSFNDIVSKIDDGNIELNFSYDGNLLTKITDSYTQSQISYSYNNDFLINSITYAGKKEDIAYNLDSEVISIGNYQITRDSNGFVSKVNDSNYQKEYSYNSYGEVTQIKDNTLTVNLTRNRLSQIVRKEETINNKTIVYEYSYDKLGRLTKVTKDKEIVEEYTYDENSNRVSAKVNGKTANATYNSQDQLTNYNNTSYTYDTNGNLIKKQNDTNQTSYSYDDFNNLKEVTLPDGKKISYITNPLNQRVAKLVNGEIKEKYLWKDLTTLLAIYDKDNNLIYRFEYANGRMPVSMTDKNNNRYYLHYDQVGSLRAITDSSGNIVKDITYDSYGNIINDTNPNFKVPFGFAGGLYDSDTKLVHFGYREYDPQTGRWLSKDPLLFGGGDSNLYGYVLQDPVNLVDPWGLMTKKIDPAEELAKQSYCTAWLMHGDSGCDKVIELGHKVCLTAGSPGLLKCQKIYQNLYKECNKGLLDCQKKKNNNKNNKDNNESCDINTSN